MFVKTLKITLLSGLIMLACSAASSAQQTITPEKQALIKELLDVTDATKTVDALVNTIISQSDRMSAEATERILAEKKNLTPAMREALQRELSEKAVKNRQRFKEAFLQKINISQLLADVSYPLYDKYYTESELRDLIAFYKSPTGKKLIETAPQLFAESMERTSRILLPKLEQVMTEIFEEQKEMDKKVSEPDKIVQPPSNTKPRRATRRTSRH